MGLSEILKNDEIVSPAAFLIFGLCGLIWFQIIKFYEREKGGRNARLAALLARFESHKRISWILVVFGCLWLLQTLVEKSWAA